MPEVQTEQITTTSATGRELPLLVITLLKGVIYHEANPDLWALLLKMQAAVRDYVSVLGLKLILDEVEGYAFLRSHTDSEEGESDVSLPRLLARRPLSFHVSLLLALLRKKLAEFDALGGGTRLILTRNEIVDLLRLFVPESTNDVKLANKIDAHINKIVELGFLRRLKAQSSREDTFEVQRILKSFVDAQWLTEFDARLAAYQERYKEEVGETQDD
ncbi:MAG TPA: DUF4194 domain-containing protein [Candidatus Obscuribacterales bacterium]